METMQEVNKTTRDEYGLKAGGVLNALEKFGTYFGLRLAHLFAASEGTSKALQNKDRNVQEALSCVGVLKAYFQRHRSDKEFEQFCRKTVQLAEELDISPPVLPRYH